MLISAESWPAAAAGLTLCSNKIELNESGPRNEQQKICYLHMRSSGGPGPGTATGTGRENMSVNLKQGAGAGVNLSFLMKMVFWYFRKLFLLLCIVYLKLIFDAALMITAGW